MTRRPMTYIVTCLEEGNESMASNQRVFRNALAAAPTDAAE